jgi:hypothetical protein
MKILLKPNFKKSKRALIALAACQLLTVSAFAAPSDSERIADLEKRLEKSLALIEQLATRLSQVEGQKVAPMHSTTDSAPATQVERIERLEKAVVQVSENSAKKGDLGVPMRGFADVGYVGTNSKHLADGKSGFTLGTLGIYLTPSFGDRVKSIVELAFEYDDDGELFTDLERLQIGYTFSDALTLWAGRYHTPYGHWNAAFHHGTQIQTSVTRPRMIDFEDRGGILPAHAVGLLASGAVPLGQGQLQYDAYLANGSAIKDGVLTFNSIKDDNTNKLIGGNLRYAFAGSLEGLTVGAHGLTQVVDNAHDSTRTRVNVWGALAVLDRGNWEGIGEYYRFHNHDLSGFKGTLSSWAGFAQLGYTLAEKYTPYARLEKAVLDSGDNYFLGQISGRSYQRQALGLRYDLNAFSALKLELNKTTDASGEKTNEVHLQLAIRF